MGRELQKHKNRSGFNKVRMKPKSKKAQLVKNAIIAANWDKSQTLEQNYKRLGLATKLNKTTGGVERTAEDVTQSQLERDDSVQDREHRGDPLKIRGEKHNGVLNVSEAKVERDPITGRILRVIEVDAAKPNPLNDPLNELDSESEEEAEEWHGFNEHGTNSSGAELREMDGETVRQLTAEANKPAVKYRANQSEGERAFIAELVSKYGDDYGKMARDIKINYMQRSEGDLKRRVQKWKKEGGRV